MSFRAKYAGHCTGCKQPIEVGDEVVYVDDVLVHEGCRPAGEQLSRLDLGAHEVVCPVCFMIRPCPCDDERRAA